MKALSQTPRSEKQVPPRTLRGGDDADVHPMRLRVETSEGVLLVYDSADPFADDPEVQPEYSGFLAYYLSIEDATVYVFGGVLEAQADLAEVLFALQRDLGVDLEVLSDSDERLEAVLSDAALTDSPADGADPGRTRGGSRLSRGLEAARPDRGVAAWEPATMDRAVEIMGFDPANLPEEDESPDGGVAVPIEDPCASVPEPPKRCGSPIGVIMQALEFVVSCGGGGGCTGPCCNSPDPCCGNSNPCCGNPDPCCPCPGACCGGSCCSGACCNGQCCSWGGSCCNGSCCAGPCCNGVCCPAGGSCCNGQCCAGTCCNGVCCPVGDSCCNGQCCNGTCCNGSCCPEGASCCAGHCCAGPCCNRFCCPEGGSCCNGVCCSGPCCAGVCCPSGGSCCGGSSCCDSDEFCCNAELHLCCNQGTVLPGGDEPVGAEECCGDHCCPTGGVAGTGVCCGDACCADGLTCCDGTTCCPADRCCPGGVCCPVGEKCCNGTTCCPESRCCPSGVCCPDACERCESNGVLSGGAVIVDPSVVCVGDTIEFTVSGVIDNGGTEWVNCTFTAGIFPGMVTYTWVITEPDGTQLTGSGDSASVTTGFPGTYSCEFTAHANRICPPPALTLAPKTAQAVKIRPQSVTFSGAQMYPIAKDDGTGLYPTPHWQDNSNPKDDDNADVGDHNIPVAYVRDSRMTLTAEFTIDPPGGLTDVSPVTITGTGSGGGVTYIFTGTATATGATVTLLNAQADVPLPNSIQYLNPLALSWSFAGSGAQPFNCPVSGTSHRVYVLLGAPNTGSRFETLVHLSTVNAQGATNEAAAASLIWNEFTDRVVKRKPYDGLNNHDEVQLTYWSTTNPAPPPLCWTTAGLLQIGDGRCGAWADFLLESLRVQGISSALETVITAPSLLNAAAWTNAVQQAAAAGTFPPNTASVSQGLPLFFVKLWDLTGADPFNPVDNMGVEGQGNANPRSAFDNHAVVKYDNKYYDPSYGSGPFSTAIVWEDAGLDGFGTFTHLLDGQGVLINTVHYKERTDPKGTLESSFSN